MKIYLWILIVLSVFSSCQHFAVKQDLRNINEKRHALVVGKIVLVDSNTSNQMPLSLFSLYLKDKMSGRDFSYSKAKAIEIDGHFALAVPPGKYNLKSINFSEKIISGFGYDYTEYTTVYIDAFIGQDIEVKQGEILNLGEIYLNKKSPNSDFWIYEFKQYDVNNYIQNHIHLSDEFKNQPIKELTEYEN